MDHNVPTLSRADRGSALARAARRVEPQLRGVRRPLYATGSGREGIVHVIGPELGLTQPGHDDRLRRQPHVDARRVRRARVRRRHVGGRARAGDADAAAGRKPKTALVRFEGALPPGLTAEGRGPRDHRPDRRRRRRRARARVRRRGDRALLDGRAHDALQHVDRGRRARRHGRARRHDVRVPRGPASSRRQGPSGSRRSTDGALSLPTRARATTARSTSTSRHSSRR